MSIVMNVSCLAVFMLVCREEVLVHGDRIGMSRIHADTLDDESDRGLGRVKKYSREGKRTINSLHF